MSKVTSDDITAQQVLQQTLTLAQVQGWERLTLAQVAKALDCHLDAIYQHFAQKDDLVDAWFDSADRALLSQVPNQAWSNLSGAERVERVIWAWLEHLAPYQKVTGDMLLYKLEPGHFHLQAAGILRVSRTVQWFREAANLRVTHVQRIGQELVLSKLFIATMIKWLNDKSAEQKETRQWLRRKLQSSARCGLWR